MTKDEALRLALNALVSEDVELKWSAVTAIAKVLLPEKTCLGGPIWSWVPPEKDDTVVRD